MIKQQDRERVAVEAPTILDQRVEGLRALFPEAFAEGRIDFETLRLALGDVVDTSPERYSLGWAGKRDAMRLLQTPSTAALKPDVAESIDFGATGNAFVEGDNLEVLKLLHRAYFGRVKMIYIDPPYNTGQDFVYCDDYAEPLSAYLVQTGQTDDEGRLLTSNRETGGRYHSAWLSMIYPRLLLARQLLRDDGVIFVSIDDHEVNNLRLVMDEIFGPENFLAQIVVQLNPRGRHLDTFVAKTHEYLMVYAANIDQQVTFGLEKDERMSSEYNREDERGKYREIELRNRNPSFNRQTRPNLYYPIYVDPKTASCELCPDAQHAVEVLPKNSQEMDSCWTWGREKFAKNRHLLLGRQSGGGWRIFRKDYLVRNEGQTATTIPKSLWAESEINNDYGKKAVQALFEGETLFDFPKSPALIKKILRVATTGDDLVLDFFAGSGTTAQAVIELNREDGGRRKFICVQLPEKLSSDSPAGRRGYRDLADLCRERIARALARTAEGADGPARAPLLNEVQDLGLRVFKFGPSVLRRWEPPPPDTTVDEYANQLALWIDDPIEGRHALHVIYEVALKEGFGLGIAVEREADIPDAEVWRVTDPDREQSFHICLDDHLDLAALRPLGLDAGSLFICRDSAIDDSTAANLALQCHLKTI